MSCVRDFFWSFLLVILFFLKVIAPKNMVACSQVSFHFRPHTRSRIYRSTQEAFFAVQIVSEAVFDFFSRSPPFVLFVWCVASSHPLSKSKNKKLRSRFQTLSNCRGVAKGRDSQNIFDYTNSKNQTSMRPSPKNGEGKYARNTKSIKLEINSSFLFRGYGTRKKRRC